MTVEEAKVAADAINQMLAAGQGAKALACAIALRDRLRENVASVPALLPNLQNTEQAIAQMQAAGVQPSSGSVSVASVPSGPTSGQSTPAQQPQNAAASVGGVICMIALWFIYMGASEYYGGSQTRSAVQGTVLENNPSWTRVTDNYMSSGTTKILIGLVLFVVGGGVAAAGGAAQAGSGGAATTSSTPGNPSTPGQAPPGTLQTGQITNNLTPEQTQQAVGVFLFVILACLLWVAFHR